MSGLSVGHRSSYVDDLAPPRLASGGAGSCRLFGNIFSVAGDQYFGEGLCRRPSVGVASRGGVLAGLVVHGVASGGLNSVGSSVGFAWGALVGEKKNPAGALRGH